MSFNALSRACTRLLFSLILLAAVLPGQDYRGRIQGDVRDSSNAVIAGATVTLSNVNTGISTVRKTNETGHYLFDLVEPGAYKVSVETPGFSRFVQENVPLASKGDITVDAMLKTGDVRETVTVAAEASRVQFATSKLETTVDTKMAKAYRNCTEARSCWRPWIHRYLRMTPTSNTIPSTVGGRTG